MAERIRDARGRAVPAFRAMVASRVNQLPDDARRNAWATADAAMQGQTSNTWPLAIFMLLLLIGLAIPEILTDLGLRSYTRGVLVAYVPLAWIVWWRTYRWLTTLGCLRALVSAGFCGSCGYSIAGISAQSDGCTICPECGAAWRKAG